MFGEIGPKLKSWFVGKFLLIANGPLSVPLTVRGAPGQVANIQEWQNSSGGAVASLASNGTYAGSAATFTGTVLMQQLGVNAATATVMITAAAQGQTAGTIGILVKANATGVGMILEGTVLPTVQPLLVFTGLDSTTIRQSQGIIDSAWANSTHAARTGRITVSAADFTGTNKEGFRVESDGTQPLIGFFGGNAAAKPAITGSRGGNAALTSLLTSLAGLSLITDSTTA